MKIKSNYLFLFYIFLLVNINFSCSKSSGCEQPIEEVIEGETYGRINFNDSTLYWLPDSPQKQIIFRSSNGFTSAFNLSKIDTTSGKPAVNRSYKQVGCVTEITENYAVVQNKFFSYTPEKDIFPISISKIKYIKSESKTASIINEPHLDVLQIKIANQQIWFSTGWDSFSNCKYTFLPNLNLDGTSYTNVYQILNNEKSTIRLVLSEVYFKPGEGVVAFKFSNNEIWTKQ